MHCCKNCCNGCDCCKQRFEIETRPININQYEILSEKEKFRSDILWVIYPKNFIKN